MKPRSWILSLLLVMPAVGPMLSAVADNSGRYAGTDLIAATINPSETSWFPVRNPVSIEELSGKLGIDETRLASLNGVNEDYRFIRGEWLALPSQEVSSIRAVAVVDLSSRRTTPPINPLITRVGIGDTLPEIARRYGLSTDELIALNPDLSSGSLVVGSRLRLSESAPAIPQSEVLALNPSVSGGASWPDQPDFGQPRGFQGPGATSYIWPTDGVFTSGYGWRWGRMHRGIDLANSVGTPIRAVQDGRVTFSGWHDGGFGYLVELTHPDGTVTLYAHNSQLQVREGETVVQGQVISLMGSTGRSTGPHLHFEIRPGGQSAVNPLQFLPPKA